MMFPRLTLHGPVDSSARVDPEDTIRAKTALNQLGYYRPPEFGITEVPDGPLFEGMRRFQKDNGLKADGITKPGGSTEQLLNAALAVVTAEYGSAQAALDAAKVKLASLIKMAADC